MVIKDARTVQAEMSEDGGHSDDGDSDSGNDEQDGILVRHSYKLLLLLRLMLGYLSTPTGPLSFHPYAAWHT